MVHGGTILRRECRNRLVPLLGCTSVVEVIERFTTSGQVTPSERHFALRVAGLSVRSFEGRSRQDATCTRLSYPVSTCCVLTVSRYVKRPRVPRDKVS